MIVNVCHYFALEATIRLFGNHEDSENKMLVEDDHRTKLVKFVAARTIARTHDRTHARMHAQSLSLTLSKSTISIYMSCDLLVCINSRVLAMGALRILRVQSGSVCNK